MSKQYRLPTIVPAHLGAIRAVAGDARARYAFRAWGEAQETVAKLERGGSLFCLMTGRVSMIDIIAACMERTGPVERMTLWIYTPGRAEIESLWRLWRMDQIKDIRFIVDHAGLHSHYRQTFFDLQDKWGRGCLRVTQNHCKMATMVGGGWNIVLDGSVNLARNLRFENLRVSDDEELLALVEGLAAELWDIQGPPDLAELSKQEADATVTKITGQRRARRDRRSESSAAGTNFGADFFG